MKKFKRIRKLKDYRIHREGTEILLLGFTVFALAAFLLWYYLQRLLVYVPHPAHYHNWLIYITVLYPLPKSLQKRLLPFQMDYQTNPLPATVQIP